MSHPRCSMTGRIPSGPAAVRGSNSAIAFLILLSEKMCDGSHIGSSLGEEMMGAVTLCGGGVFERVTPSLKCTFVIMSRVSSGDSVSFPSGFLTVPSLAVLVFFTMEEIFLELDLESSSLQKSLHEDVLAFLTSFLYWAWCERSSSQLLSAFVLRACLSLCLISFLASPTSLVSHGGFRILEDT